MKVAAVAATGAIAALEAAREELKSKDVVSTARISELEAELARREEERVRLVKELDEANVALRAADQAALSLPSHEPRTVYPGALAQCAVPV